MLLIYKFNVCTVQIDRYHLRRQYFGEYLLNMATMPKLSKQLNNHFIVGHNTKWMLFAAIPKLIVCTQHVNIFSNEQTKHFAILKSYSSNYFRCSLSLTPHIILFANILCLFLICDKKPIKQTPNTRLNCSTIMIYEQSFWLWVSAAWMRFRE